MAEEAQELWWNRIHGPRQLKEQVLEGVLRPGRSVWIGGEVPWMETLQRQVKDELGEKSGQTCLTCRRAEELQGLDPAKLLFQLNPEARFRYMPGKPLAEYVRDNRLLETHVLWLSGLEAGRDDAWFALSRDLARLKTGLQVLCQGQFGNQRHQNITVLRTKDAFTEFDRILFAMQLAADSGVSADLRIYGSYLAVGLAGGQAEAIPGLMRAPEGLTRNPEEAAECLGIDRESLAQILHRVQVQVLLPKLEERQERLVDELSENLRRLLPFEDEYGRVYQELYEVELRNMHHLYGSGALRLEPRQAERLDQLYRLRNLVAHRKIVPGDAAADFLC